jgi:hypothetical protein
MGRASHTTVRTVLVHGGSLKHGEERIFVVINGYFLI